MTDNTMPDVLYVAKTKEYPYKAYSVGFKLPHDAQYHHHRIVEAQQAEIERLRECRKNKDNVLVIKNETINRLESEVNQALAENKALREHLTEIINLTDRKHDVWDRAKQTLKGNE